MRDVGQQLDRLLLPGIKDQSTEVREESSTGTLNKIFNNRLLRALTAAGALTAATACGSPDEQVSDSENFPTTTKDQQLQYPELLAPHRGLDSDGKVDTLEPTIFNARINYTVTLVDVSNPFNTCTFNTRIDDRGYDSYKCQFDEPLQTAKASVSYIDENGTTISVPLKGLCEGEPDNCIRGFDTYPD